MAEPTQSTQKPGMAARLRHAAGKMLQTINYRLHVAAANMWRDSYNPLRGLTMARAVSLLEEGERGAYADLQWTYRFIEMQDATLGALVKRRLSAIGQMDWDIRTSDRAQTPEEIALAEKQADALKQAYEGIGNLRRAIAFLALASFRGYSHLEIVRNADGDITELAKVEQWHWVRNGLAGQWEYNPESRLGVNSGEDVPMDRFITREEELPINRVALVSFLRKNLSQKDWDGFVETYGIPAIFVVMPPELGESQRDEFQSVAEDIIADARGVLPGNSDIKTIDNGARGVNPFRDHIKYQDEQMVLRGTGGKLTMLAESGSGTLAGGAHADTFEQIAKAEAAEISELLRERIDRDILDKHFPGQPHLAYFEIAANEETDSGEIVADVQKLAAAGYLVDAAWLEEKTGYKLKAEGRGMKDEGKRQKTEDLKTKDPEPEIMNRKATAGTAVVQDEGNLLAAAAEMLAVARVKDTDDLAGELRMILGIEDEEEMTAALQEWRDALPGAVAKTAAMDAAWERVLAVAFASGLGAETQDGKTQDASGIRNSGCGTGKGGFQPANHCSGKKGNRREGETKPSIPVKDEPRVDPRLQEEIARQKTIMSEALAARDSGKGGIVNLGEMSDAGRKLLADAAGRIELGDGKVVLQVEPQRLRHQQKAHAGSEEMARGQSPLTDDDFVRKMPLVMTDPDSVELSEESGIHGEPRFYFRRKMNATHTVIVELRESKRKDPRATAVTQWVSNRTSPMFSPSVTSLSVVRAWMTK